jgi:putative NADH-flavin reductase
MKLTVFGASGRIGGHLVRQALDAGHAVTAVVRDAARFEVRDAALAVATVPDLGDLTALLPTLEDCDGALSAVGPRGRNDGPVAATATRCILRALEASSVRRFVAVSAVPVGPTPDGESFVNRRLLLPMMGAFLRDLYADLAVMEGDIRDSATDWTILRPPKLVDKPLTATYRTVVGANVPRGYFISRADAAHAMLASFTSPATIRQPLGVAY